MSNLPLLSFTPQPGAVVADLDALLTSRMLIQANSGGGKSWALRYLIEQTHGRVQQIILDPEGEFASLRERFPFVLIGQEGDVAANPATAAQVCRRLLELQASAVVDLYDLKLAERRRFVRLFLDALIHVERPLWHPLMVILDEAHRFAPERGAGEAESTEAVIALCSEGRKRPFCAVLATQRIAKLHKDAAAELLNVLIGRTGLDVDVLRAGDTLGFAKEQRQTLKQLDPGVFYAFGPAISREVVQVRTGPVVTTHPAPGMATPPAPPPPEQIRALLGQLADLPTQAAAEARDLETAQQRIVEVEVPVLHPDQIAQLERAIEPLFGVVREISAALARLNARPRQEAKRPRPARASTPKARPAVRRTKSNAKSASIAKPKERRSAPRRRTAAAAGALDEIAQILAIPAIAAKLAQARQRVNDRSAAYMPRILRMVWNVALSPDEIAEGQGTPSRRTIERIQTACRALVQARLLVEEGDRLQVNHEELRRLRALASALQREAS